jgi:phasin
MAASDRFEVPPELRTFAEKSVEQARQAFDGFISAAHHAMSAFEGQAESARKGARDVTEKAMTFAERNMASAFEFAHELVRARDLQEVVRLQGDLHQAPDGGADGAGAGARREHEQGGEGRRCAEGLTPSAGFDRWNPEKG